MKTPEENVIQETTGSGEKAGINGIELNSSNSQQLNVALNKLDEMLTHDKGIEQDQLMKLDSMLDSAKVTIGGKEISFEEVAKLYNDNFDIWTEIRGGVMRNIGGLTYITDDIAKILSEIHEYLYLNNLLYMSDFSAKCLSQHICGSIFLEKISSLSDVGLEYFTKRKYEVYFGFTELSDSMIEILSKYRASEGELGGYRFIMRKLANISDKAVIFIDQHRGGDYYSGKITVTDEMLREVDERMKILNI